ncbi:hypothetical protein OJF2_60670 [Aquisphaera giovannonii]|uniref:Tetratricopeptide repeat protein n=1 Tax=Aquisphaera giovannonii TaxID=406548 RepID=A0A5B9WAB8_9BACT|nr:hypothetical protein [Aquisphaera giovannonii]QEH37476.1 hypothetical protein OJF2_60670 [Aquisphaera giovannonii]
MMLCRVVAMGLGIATVVIAGSPEGHAEDLQGEALARAAEAAARVEGRVDRAEAWLKIGEARVRRREPAAARAAFEAAAGVALQIHPREVAVRYNRSHPVILVAQAQAASGDREAAHATFLRGVEMLSAPDQFGNRPWDWGPIVRAQIQLEGRDAADSTIRRYRAYAEEGLARDRETLRSGVLKARGDFFEATRLRAWCGDYAGAVRDILNNEDFVGPLGDDPDSSRRFSLVHLLNDVPASDREAANPLLAAARKAVDDAGLPGRPVAGESCWQRAEQYCTIAVTLSRLGRFAEALETIAQAAGVPEPPPPNGGYRHTIARSYVLIAEDLRAAGDREGSLATLRKAIPFYSEPRGGRLTTSVANLTRGFLRLRAFDEARRLIEEAYPRWRRPTLESRTRLKLLESLADAQVDAGERAAAVVTLESALADAEMWRVGAVEIPENQRRFWSKPEPVILYAIAAARIRARLGEAVGARRLIESLKPGEPRDEGRRGFAVARAEAGDWTEALSMVRAIADPKIRDRAWIEVATVEPRPRPPLSRP